MRLKDRVAIVTGAGRGLGRAHALHLASQGAAVLVNDRGSSLSGSGQNISPAMEVVEEIRSAGGRAAASNHDVSDWHEACAMIASAVSEFGDLHILINNAGILRDRTLANMTEDEWDAVIRVHLKGHAAPTKFAIEHWRAQSKAGKAVKASVVHTSSIAGFCGNRGQANYASAKMAVVALSSTVALEASSYGVRSNVISPSARTRITESVPGSSESLVPTSEFDVLDPANVSPLVSWLAEESCPANSQTFHIVGSDIFVMQIPAISQKLKTSGRWTAEELDRVIPDALIDPLPIESFFVRNL
jgi:NAD(P)-dependent dehydrogenase (short-subunit alcohol dehydrogenase family)